MHTEKDIPQLLLTDMMKCAHKFVITILFYRGALDITIRVSPGKIGSE